MVHLLIWVFDPYKGLMRRYLGGAPELSVQTKITRPFISSALFLAVLDLAMLPLQLETAVSVVLDKSNAETGTGVVMVRPGKAVPMFHMVWLEHKIWASWLQPGKLWLRCQDWTDLLGWSIVALVMDSCCCRQRSRDRQTWFEYRSCSLGQLLLLYKDWAGRIKSS